MSNRFQTLDPQLRPFLLSPLWQERREMTLSLLSALARLDLDPWSEAAALAELPRERALSRLCDLLSQTPGAPSPRAEVMRLCTALIDRLPPVARPGAPSGPLRPPVVRETLFVTIICSALLAQAAFVIVTAQAERSAQKDAVRGPAPAGITASGSPIPGRRSPLTR